MDADWRVRPQVVTYDARMVKLASSGATGSTDARATGTAEPTSPQFGTKPGSRKSGRGGELELGAAGTTNLGALRASAHGRS